MDGRITDLRMGEPLIYENGFGDTWDPAWGADDALYFPGNDGRGFDNACASNLFFNRATGDDYKNLVGVTVNPMSDYGPDTAQEADECTTKSSGCLCLDGVTYLAIARHKYGARSGDPFGRQIATGANIIKSYDYGKTWQRGFWENYENPMFASQRFATPYFIHYGKDGASPNADKAREYVYAISNNGYWSNGDNYILGRILRSEMEALNPDDWQFYCGGDGMEDGSWSCDMNRAAHIIENPLRCGETGATYLPALKRYILVAWGYLGNPSLETQKTIFTFYEAPHPWGPWTQVCRELNDPQGYYCPRILSKFQSLGENGELEAVLVTGGDYYPSAFYRFITVPVTIKAGGKLERPAPPQTAIVDCEQTDGPAAFTYRGQWRLQSMTPKAYNGRFRFSVTPGDNLTLGFKGKRVKLFATTGESFGIANISVDGKPVKKVDLWSPAFYFQHQRQVFDSGPLPCGEHTLTLEVTGKKNERSKSNIVSIDHAVIEL